MKYVCLGYYDKSKFDEQAHGMIWIDYGLAFCFSNSRTCSRSA
jgi:hypothetical protein